MCVWGGGEVENMGLCVGKEILLKAFTCALPSPVSYRLITHVSIRLWFSSAH